MQQIQGPVRGRIYGLTHDSEGKPIIALPRNAKLSLGRPAGPMMHAHVGKNGKMIIDIGTKVKGESIREYFSSVESARAYWLEKAPTAPVQKFPSQLSYFTFRRIEDGVLIPDFEAIFIHGWQPTRLAIRLCDTVPFDPNMKWWGPGLLKCWGDGMNASRRVEFPDNAEQRALAEEAKKRKQHFFTILNGCSGSGCMHALATIRDGREYPADCKRNGVLGFMLEKLIRLGGQCEYFTTGKRSIEQIHSAVTTLQNLAESRGMSTIGVPCELIAEPYQTKDPTGKKVTKYAVRLEVDSTFTDAMIRVPLIAGAGPGLRQIEAPADDANAMGEDLPIEDADPSEAAAITAEFYPAEQEGDDLQDPSEQSQTTAERVQTATVGATESLKAKIDAQAEKVAPKPAPVETKTEPAPAAPAATAAPAAENPGWTPVLGGAKKKAGSSLLDD